MASWGEQYSTGDQGNFKRLFWESSYSVCPLCDGKEIKNTKVCAGCRYNGDGYGTEEFECTKCQWKTSFQYDEADDGPYFYETRNWKRSRSSTGAPSAAPSAASAEPPEKPEVPLSDERREIYKKMTQHCPMQHVLNVMLRENVSMKEMEEILAEYNNKPQENDVDA